MSREIPFDPFPFFEDPHQQTILSAFFPHITEPSSTQKLIRLPDGDQISLEVTTPLSWKPTNPTVVLVHGLCGSHKSPCVLRMAKRLEPLGVRAVRYNMRGCGSGRGLSKYSYHSGRSEDVFEVLKTLKKEHPESPILLIGFSLGGNVVLKLAGELSRTASSFLAGLVAVSPPVDLFSSAKLLAEPHNALYENYFYRILRADVHYRHKKFKDLPRVQLPQSLKLYEFDQIYTAPIFGFRDVQDYYTKCSAIHFVSEIEVPCKILLAEDDPIVSATSLDHQNLPDHVSVFKTKKGGHMGYLGNPLSERGLYWLDHLLIEWIKEFDLNSHFP